MPQNFIFLEITDPEINAFIYSIISTISKQKRYSNVHITVRGPYIDSVPAADILFCEKTMQYKQLLLSDFGKFEERGNFIVYLKIKNKWLRKIWWKPDYPISKYGFNPHITIYKGKNEYFANELYTFLVKENIHLLCDNYRFTQYAQKQMEMFPDINNNKNKFLGLLNNRKVSLTFLARLDRLVKKHKSNIHKAS